MGVKSIWYKQICVSDILYGVKYLHNTVLDLLQTEKLKHLINMWPWHFQTNFFPVKTSPDNLLREWSIKIIYARQADILKNFFNQ